MNGNIELTLALMRDEFSLGLDVQLPSAGVTAVFGPSGSGKTTLLRCIAGLEPDARGAIRVGEDVWQSRAVFKPTHQRPVGYVFQEASLFPHLSAEQNLAYASRRARSGSAIDRERVIAILDLVPLLARLPKHLSGGERQRIAIARALLINPALLLMDEPLASLDQTRKEELLPYLDTLKSELNIPIIYVSHSVKEVTRLADHMVVMSKGRVSCDGPLSSTYRHPEMSLLLGEDTGVVLDAKVQALDSRWQLTQVLSEAGNLWLRSDVHQAGQSLRLRILAKDVSITLSRSEDSSILNILSGTVSSIKEDKSGSALVGVAVGSVDILARITLRSVDALSLAVGKPVWAQIKSVALIR